MAALQTRRTARVLYEFVATRSGEMSCSEGEEVTVKREPDARGWVLVERATGDRGYVPNEWLAVVEAAASGRPVSFFSHIKEKVRPDVVLLLSCHRCSRVPRHACVQCQV